MTDLESYRWPQHNPKMLDKDDPGYGYDGYPVLEESLEDINDRFCELLRKAYPSYERINKMVQTTPKRSMVFNFPDLRNPYFGNMDRPSNFVPSQKKQANTIIELIAKKHGVSFNDILSERKAHKIIKARWEAIYEVRKAFPMWSYPRIGRQFNKDHTTILHAVKSYKPVDESN